MDAYGLQLLYNKTGNFYVKLVLKKYKLDDDYRSKVYVSFGKYFLSFKNLFLIKYLMHMRFILP